MLRVAEQPRRGDMMDVKRPIDPMSLMHHRARDLEILGDARTPPRAIRDEADRAASDPFPFEHFTVTAITGAAAIAAVTIFSAYIGLGPVFSILAAATLGLLMWDLFIGTFGD